MQKLPNFISLKKLSLVEFIDTIRETTKFKISKNGTPYQIISTRKKHWIYLIENGMLECPVTNKKVAYCSYDRMDYGKKGVKSTFHYNFYSEDNELFSIDHKLPISKGGHKTTVSNIQPMVMSKNFEKKNELIFTK